MWKEWMRYRMARRVLMAEISVWRVRGRPRLGWIDGVKVALGNRAMRVKAARQFAKDSKEWRALVHICLALCFFRTPLPCSGGYHLERGGMPLHDAVGINWKRAQLLKIKALVSSIWAKGCMIDNCVCVYLTWHDYPSLVEGQSHGVLYYYSFN